MKYNPTEIKNAQNLLLSFQARAVKVAKIKYAGKKNIVGLEFAYTDGRYVRIEFWNGIGKMERNDFVEIPFSLLNMSNEDVRISIILSDLADNFANTMLRK